MSLLHELAVTCNAGEPCVLATVYDHTGSAPRGKGAWMLVRSSGEDIGTIGGGSVEHRVQEEAQAMLRDGPPSALRRYDLSDRQAADLGMVCGGRMRVLLERVEPGSDNANTFARAQELLQRKGCVTMVVDAGTPKRCRRLLLEDGGVDEKIPGHVRLAAETAVTVETLEVDGGLWIVQPVRFAEPCIIMGAGHVAVHVSSMAARVGFRTIVADDRAEFANRERFPDAEEVLVLDSFDDCFKSIAPDPESYVVILTRGHAHDKAVLAQTLKREAAYIGMIGSRTKRAATYKALEADGVAPAMLQAVHCPIGLGIGAVTPEEIGLAIVAEMVQARAGRRQ